MDKTRTDAPGTLGMLGQMRDLPGYGPDTMGILEKMRLADQPGYQQMLRNIRFSEGAVQHVFFTDDPEDPQLCAVLPTDRDRANAILLAPLEQGLKKGELASDHYNIRPSQIAMIAGPDMRYKVNQDLMICAAMMVNPPLCVDEVNHVLMEVCQPGLFTMTYDPQINLRNFVLTRLLEYAQDHPCPRDWWLSLARDILACLNLPPLHKLSGSARQLSSEEAALARSWYEEARRTIPPVNFMTLRKRAFDAYRTNTRQTQPDAINTLKDKVFMSADSIIKLLTSQSSTRRSRGSRDSLIRLAIHLGCSFEEANLMLLQAGFALLYPMRQDDTERDHIKALQKNPGLFSFR